MREKPRTGPLLRLALAAAVSGGLALFEGPPAGGAVATAQGPGPARPAVLKALKSDRSPALRSLPPRARVAPPAAAQAPGRARAPAAEEPAPATESAGDVYELPLYLLPDVSGDAEADEEAPPAVAPRAGRAVAPPDGLASGPAAGLALAAPAVSFDGLSNEDNRAVLGFRVAPPDPSGAAGPDHYVQWVNLVFAVYDKAGERLYGPAAGSTLWAGFGGLCEEQNDGDVIVLYDKYANRWLLSQFANVTAAQGPYYQCLAVSATSDPLGAYHRYAFLVSDTKLNDYPKFGVWPDGYYMSVNQFRAGTLAFAGAGLFAFERDRMLLGAPANAVYFDLEALAPPLIGGLLPSDADGVLLPPAGSPNAFAHFGAPPTFPTHRLQLFEFRVDWLSPAASTLSGPQVITVAPFNPDLCPAVREQCVPQPGTPQPLEAISDRLMWRLQYRNFADHATLVTNHTVNAGAGRAGVRWYELRQRPGPGQPWGLFQQGTYAPPDGVHRWMGSLAMDARGDLALGFTASSAALFPSVRYVGRQRSDPAGTLPRGETVLVNGPAAQVGSARWGDYSQMALDPDDDCTFWFTHEYVERSDIAVAWRTRIAAFRFDGCGRSNTG